MLSVAISLLCLSTTIARITEIPLPDVIKRCTEHSQMQPQTTQTVGEVIFNRCVQKVLWVNHQRTSTQKLPESAVKWIKTLTEMNGLNAVYDVTSEGFTESPTNAQGNTTFGLRFRRQATQRQTTAPRQPRVRKEYRMLTYSERSMFHRAINMLKTDTTVSPNKFDALGRLHYLSVGKAHDGPNFNGWHRMFLVVMENALREKIPSVTIPYWDSTLDDNLLDPRSSVIWTPEFFGTANGYVNDGPFGGWETPFGPLIRYFGSSGTMLNWTYVQNSLRQQHLADISSPYALPENNLEEHHNQVHLWVGGHMAPPTLAAFDPVFYLLHSFTDMIWEIFRGLQKNRGIDPVYDYPRNTSALPPGQGYNDQSGFGTLENRHGLSNVFTDNIYKYQRPPTCTVARPDCGSEHIRCDTSGVKPKCVSASIFDLRQVLNQGGIPMDGSSGIREFARRRRNAAGGKHQTHIVKNVESAVNRIANVKCDTKNVDEKYVNNYIIDGKVDKQQWVYIPIQIVFRNSSKQSNSSLQVPVYEHCKRSTGSPTPNRVFIESNGINYSGMYKSTSHFATDVNIDTATTNVAVKRPSISGDTEAIIAAYDACGRMCQPYCRDRNGAFQQCTGAISVSKYFPIMYGNDANAVTSFLWQDDVSGLPVLNREKLFVQMLCDVTATLWPWSHNLD